MAVTVAQLGGSAGYVTRLPRHEIAERALAELRGLGVDVSGVVRGGDRMGVYFVEHGAGVRPSKVIYDRAHSALAEARPEDFQWAEILAGARWLHWSGITPALSPRTAEICGEACAAARQLGLTVSFDLNYRAKLWSEAEAGRVLTPLMSHVGLCITSVEEARQIFGIDIPAEAPDREELAVKALCGKFGFSSVALTSRQAGTADETEWGAMLFQGGKTYRSKRYRTGIVDRLGAGDSFTGGLIFALLRGDGPQEAIELAAATSTLKHTVYGDYARLSLAEVEAQLTGGAGGRVQR